MSLPRWDEEMKFELLRLKSELRPENFRVLHSPIGLSPLRAKEEAAPPAEAGPPRAADARFASIPALPELSRQPTQSFSRSLTKMMIVHSLDVAFVSMSLALGLLLASYLIDPSHVSDNPGLLKRATPIRFLFESNALTLVFGLYGFFSLYWLFFKLVSGSTLGESFLDNFWSLQNPRRTARLKDSGDS